MDAVQQFDALIRQLQAAVNPVAGDAIDIEIARPPRTTATVNLAEAPEIVAFRNELVDGLIRQDTVRQVLTLVQTVLAQILR